MGYLNLNKKQINGLYSSLIKYYRFYKDDENTIIRVIKTWVDYFKKDRKVVKFEIIGERTRVCVFICDEDVTNLKVGQYKDFNYKDFIKSLKILKEVKNNYKGYKINF